MALDTEETRGRLTEFAARWGGYQGTESGEAQTFLNQLLACYGVDRVGSGARFEVATRDGGFIDMIWPGVCLVEMKRPSEAGRLPAHRNQALRYWQSVGRPGAPAPPYVVICAFHRFEVWKPGDVYTEPLATFDLNELPEHSSALLFLAGRDPGFYSNDELTREAVTQVTDLYARLDDRQAADDDVLQDFILQIVWSLFAEDLGLLPNKLLTRILDGLLEDPRRSSVDDLGRLFGYLANEHPRPEHGVYEGTPYANGGLFAAPSHVHLERAEVESLRSAADFDWTGVEPAIFGSLLTGGLGREKQWALGAHYTSEADIMKVVVPTVIEPWRERIAACSDLADAQQAQRELMDYVVLDPACGSGNFLYVAYRELRKIESDLRERVSELRAASGLADQGELSLFPIHNMRGIEIEPFAVKLARVTMWIAHKLAVDRLGVDERVLPLVDLSGIRQGDSLRVEWPRADAIISNPPYHGSQRIRKELGGPYVDWLKSEFGIGVKDYAAYWFRRAQPHLADGGRAGLVVTNSISQGKNRGPTLDWVVDTGGVITSAVSKHPWSGEANVNVSIINWVKNPGSTLQRFILDGDPVAGISPALRADLATAPSPARLPRVSGRAFQGPNPVGKGFLLDHEEAMGLMGRSEADYGDVVVPFLTSHDLGNDPRRSATRWIVDFRDRSLEEAMAYPAALEIVKDRVKPVRDRNRNKRRRERWWLLGTPAKALRAAIADIDRFIVGTRHGVRLHFEWCAPPTLAGDALNTFAFSDDASMGVLLSTAHRSWAWRQSSTIRADIRYTPRSTFETFPWPELGPSDTSAVGAAAMDLLRERGQLCEARGVGLTELYNEVDEGAHQQLQQLGVALDRAVADAYGWPDGMAQDEAELCERLLQLNRSRAAQG